MAHWKIVGENWEQLEPNATRQQTVRPEQVRLVRRKNVPNIHFVVMGNRAMFPAGCSPAASRQG